jgi:hypothetical protein
MRNFGDSSKNHMQHPARKLGTADATRKMRQELYVMLPPRSVHDQDCGISSHAKADELKTST